MPLTRPKYKRIKILSQSSFPSWPPRRVVRCVRSARRLFDENSRFVLAAALPPPVSPVLSALWRPLVRSTLNAKAAVNLRGWNICQSIIVMNNWPSSCKWIIFRYYICFYVFIQNNFKIKYESKCSNMSASMCFY